MFSHIVDVDPDGGSLHTGQGHAILEVLAVDFTLYHMILYIRTLNSGWLKTFFQLNSFYS